MLFKENSDIALYETGMQLLEDGTLSGTSIDTDQTRREKSWQCEE